MKDKICDFSKKSQTLGVAIASGNSQALSQIWQKI
jgi:hypothetical protein